MSLVERIYPKFVSALGAVGLGTAFAYFVGVVLVLRPGWEEWTQFFVVWGPPLAFVPGGMLIAHLYLRTHLGRWWLRRECFDEAAAWTKPRLEANLVRSRKETLYHRIYLARAKIGEGNYEEAVETLLEGYSVPETGREAAAIRRWQLEAALRLEDGEGVESALRAGLEADPPQPTRAALHAGRAEWAVLEGSSKAYHTHIERGRWASRESARLDLAEGFGAVRFGRDEEAYERGLENLDGCRESAVREIPGRAAEIEAVRAQLLARLGRRDDASRVLEEAESLRADARSRRRVEHVARHLDAEPEADVP